MKVAISQFKITYDIEENIKKAFKYIESSKDKADIVILPELFMTPMELEWIKKSILTIDSNIINEFKESAKRNNVSVVLGSIALKENDKIYNTSLLINELGIIEGMYKKRHPFTVEIKNNIRLDEGAIIEPSDNYFIFNKCGFKCAIIICYDIRFFDSYKQIEKEEVEVVFMPASFNHYTGPLHWEVLGRARSIDYQIYNIMCAPSRNDKTNFKTYGHSLAIDPLGKIITDLGEGEKQEIVVLDKNYISKIRKSLRYRKIRLETRK